MTHQRGSVLLITFLLLMTLSVMAAAYVYLTGTATRFLMRESNVTIDRYGAEAAVERSLRLVLDRGTLDYLSGSAGGPEGWWQRDSLDMSAAGDFSPGSGNPERMYVTRVYDEAGKINVNSIHAYNRDLLATIFLRSGYMGTQMSQLRSICDTLVARRDRNWLGLSPGGSFRTMGAIARVFDEDGYDNDQDGEVDEIEEGRQTVWGDDSRRNHWLDSGETVAPDGGVRSLLRWLTVYSTRDTRTGMNNRAPVNANTASRLVLGAVIESYPLSLADPWQVADSLISGRYYRHYIDFEDRLQELITSGVLTTADRDSLIDYACYKNMAAGVQTGVELNFMSKTFDFIAEIDNSNGLISQESVRVDTVRRFYTYDNSSW